ncbi:lipocalin family protein [Maribacter sp. MMG018]|uniref:lipocalin family protein n=1 Tax=Maribacter sp. MMG018 TaxID=2822688 RepID=UPI001B36B919|nr:lipocalin family protein [Maribacter sp. MMG018]MBQ4913968.1 lipocalin family protein [Maribacter sp. MMG018]
MKFNIFLFLTTVFFLSSCSSDKDETPEIDSSTQIEGTWDATALRIDEDNASDDAKFGQQILEFLTNKDCYIITLTFNGDMAVTAENSSNYLEINATDSGLDVPCPTESDTESSVYTYDGSILTIVDEDGETVEVNVSIDGDIMVVDAADLDIPNFDDSGELIFMRR